MFCDEKNLDPISGYSYIGSRFGFFPVAQLVEQVTVNHLVRGSSPRRGAKYFGDLDCVLSKSLFAWCSDVAVAREGSVPDLLFS